MQIIVRETVMAGMAKLNAAMGPRILRAMRNAGYMLIDDAGQRLKHRNAPGRGLGGRDTGALATRMAVEDDVRGHVVGVRVGSGVYYDKWVEGWPKAPRRHFVPFSVAPGLRGWARRHGIALGPKATGMMVGGEKATTPFFEPALKTITPKVLPKLAELLRL